MYPLYEKCGKIKLMWSGFNLDNHRNSLYKKKHNEATVCISSILIAMITYELVYVNMVETK